MITHVECVQAQRVDGSRRPQAQGIYVSTAPSHDWDVICDCLERLGGVPDRAFGSSRRTPRLDPTAELDVVDHLLPRKLPWISEGQPFPTVHLLPTPPTNTLEPAPHGSHAS